MVTKNGRERFVQRPSDAERSSWAWEKSLERSNYTHKGFAGPIGYQTAHVHFTYGQEYPYG